MKITRVESYVLLDPGFDRQACSSAQDDIVVLVHTDEGITGVGEVDTNPWVAQAMIHARGTHVLGLGLEEMLLGEDPLQPEALWDKLYTGSLMTGRRGLGISYTVFMTPGGRWADRFGPRNMLAAMALGAGLMTALMPVGGIPGLGSLIGVIPGLVVIRVGFGVFTAPLFPAAARMNAISMPPLQRARVIGFVNAGAGFGSAVSPILVTAMLTCFGWRASFVMAGAASIVLGLLWLASVPDRPVETRAVQRPQWAVLLNNPNMRWLIAGFAALDYYEYIFFYWLYYYLGNVRKLSADDAAFYTTLPFLAWAVMMPFGGWLADHLVARYGVKRGLRSVAMGSLLISVLGLVAALNVVETNSLVALLSLAFGCSAIADVVFWAAAVSIGGTQSGVAGGLMNTGGNFGGAIAPFVTPLIASRYGWSAGLYAGALVALLGIVAWSRIDPSPVPIAPAPTTPGTPARF